MFAADTLPFPPKQGCIVDLWYEKANCVGFYLVLCKIKDPVASVFYTFIYLKKIYTQTCIITNFDQLTFLRFTHKSITTKWLIVCFIRHVDFGRDSKCNVRVGELFTRQLVCLFPSQVICGSVVNMIRGNYLIHSVINQCSHIMWLFACIYHFSPSHLRYRTSISQFKTLRSVRLH